MNKNIKMDRGSNPDAAGLAEFITYPHPHPQYVSNLTGEYFGSVVGFSDIPNPNPNWNPNPNPNPNQTALLNYGAGQNLPSSAGPVRGQQSCCLLDNGKRCHRTSGNGRFRKRSKKTVHSMKLRLGIDNVAKHIYICDHHRIVIKDARRAEQNRRDSEDVAVIDAPVGPGPAPGPGPGPGPQVDLYQLPMNTLRRYKRHCKIPTCPGVTKVQLADILQEHFKCIPVSEKEDLTYFIYKVKSDRKKLEAKRKEAPGGAVDMETLQCSQADVCRNADNTFEISSIRHSRVSSAQQ